MGFWDNDRYGSIADEVSWSVVSLTTFVVGLRIFCRVRANPEPLGALGLDDYLTLLCLAILLTTQILITIASSYGLGKHWNTLSPEDQVQAMKYNTVINAVINWAFSMPKFAIIALLKRVLNFGTRTTFSLYFLAGIAQCTVLATSIWCFKQCDPVERNWDTSVEGKCADISILTGIGYFSSSYSAFLDLFFALYPIPFIMRLRMPLQNRIVISILLSLGSLACAIQVYKLSIVQEAFAIMGYDPSWPIPYLNTMGMSEACILILSGSLPALGPLFRRCHGRITSLASKTKSKGTSCELESGLTRVSHPSKASRGWAILKESRSRDMESGTLNVDRGIMVTTSVTTTTRDVDSVELRDLYLPYGLRKADGNQISVERIR